MANRHSFRKSSSVTVRNSYCRIHGMDCDEGPHVLLRDLLPDVQQVRDLDVDDLGAEGAGDARPVELVVVHPAEHVADDAEGHLAKRAVRAHGVRVAADLPVGRGVIVGADDHLVAGEHPHLAEGARELRRADHGAVAQGLLVVALEIDVPVALAQEHEQRRVLDVAKALDGDDVHRVGEHHEDHQVDLLVAEAPPRGVRLVHRRDRAGPHDLGVLPEGAAQVVQHHFHVGVHVPLQRAGVHAVVFEVGAGVHADLERPLLPGPVEQVAVLVRLGDLEGFHCHDSPFPTGMTGSRRGAAGGCPA